jgi:glutamine amidotransferase
VDYEAGNLRSVELALLHLDIEYVVSKYPDELADVDRLVFPGVGEARSAMDVLERTGMARFLVDFAQSGRPLLGICLGFQILMTESEERETRCLDIFPGKVKLFERKPGLKIPHMGWNQAWHKNRHPVFKGIPDGASFYFVHSYYVETASNDIEIVTTDYGIDFTSGAARENVIAFQFHPEKSGKYGLRLLENFFAAEAF